MNEAEIVRARVRAEDVINGFTCAKITHAKDVIRLANALLDETREVSRLNEIIVAMRKVSGTNSPPFDSVFSTIFGVKK